MTGATVILPSSSSYNSDRLDNNLRTQVRSSHSLRTSSSFCDFHCRLLVIGLG